MNRFEKVSFEQFYADLQSTYEASLDCNEKIYVIPEEEARNIYNAIKLPTRATKGSAGYDIFSPVHIELGYSHLTVPTGIRWVCDDPTLVLMILPRSGQGFKYGMALRNTAGIIDSDYCNAKNEGHIMCKINAEEPYTIKEGAAFAQGLILKLGMVDNEIEPEQTRVGGFGSTTERHE